MESYKLKYVRFFGREVPVVLQNENGPCPLLAIANVLLLRNAIRIPPATFQIDAERLMHIIAERLLDTNPIEATSTYAANLEQNLQDVIANMPKLMTGIDVNPKFNSIHGFEFTNETAIFDLFDINLIHGWLMDPKEPAAGYVGEMSYNQVAAKLISVLGSSSADQKEEPDLIDLETVAEAVPRLTKPQPTESNPVKCQLDFDGDRIRLRFDNVQWGSHEGHPPESDTLEDVDGWEAVRAWMDGHSSQLTPYGLMELHRRLPDRQLAVFFRNNHFSTIFKDGSHLYLLVTDQGYLAENDLVWEKLESVNNNNRFYTSSFKLFEGTSQRQETEPVTQDTELQYAIALSMEGEHPSGGGGVLPQDFLSVDPPQQHNHSDSDLALALQLQEEETMAQSHQAQWAYVPQRGRGRGRGHGLPRSGSYTPAAGEPEVVQHAFPPASSYSLMPSSRVPATQGSQQPQTETLWTKFKKVMRFNG